MIKRIDAELDALGVLVNEKIHPAFFRHAVTHLIHGKEFPRRVDVEERERRRGGIKGLARELVHDCTVLANRIKHHRMLALCNRFAHDVDAFGFEVLEVGQLFGQPMIA